MRQRISFIESPTQILSSHRPYRSRNAGCSAYGRPGNKRPSLRFHDHLLWSGLCECPCSPVCTILNHWAFTPLTTFTDYLYMPVWKPVLTRTVTVSKAFLRSKHSVNALIIQLFSSFWKESKKPNVLQLLTTKLSGLSTFLGEKTWIAGDKVIFRLNLQMRFGYIYSIAF